MGTQGLVRAFGALCFLGICSGLVLNRPHTASLYAPRTTTVNLRSAARYAPAAMGLLDDIAGGFKAAIQEFTQEVTVQHILVPTQAQARELYDSLVEAGDISSDAFGRAAQQHSTCGSAKKRPDARMAQLRGAPGELKFRRGEMAKEFEERAFAGPVGELQRPFATQFGWHLMLVNARTK